MRNTSTFLGGVAGMLLWVALASAEVQEGRARFAPWSGWWWPHQQGALQEPLGKYDQITGRKAAAWERQQTPLGPQVPSWHGYCHGWSAAAVLEAEPVQTRVVPGPGSSQVVLKVGDQKGLLTACHTRDVANFYGDRFGDGQGSEDRQDLPPDQVWQLLELYVRQQGVPLIFDMASAEEVWNYPVYAYRVEYTPQGSEVLANLTLWMADDSVPKDYVGVKVYRQDYRFTCRMREGRVVMGSGKWVGGSVRSHPDFAWYPLVAVADNPEVDYTRVKEMLGERAVPPPDSTVPNPDRPPQPPGATEQPPSDVLVLSPMELVAVVACKTSSFDLDVTVDRFDGGRYAIGEPLRVQGSSASAGYLYLIHVDPTGELALLFPAPGQENRIEAGKTFTLPGPGDKPGFRTVAPVGTHRIKAVVTSRPLLLSGLDRSQQVDPKAQRIRLRWPPSQQRLAQELVRQYQQQGQIKPEQLTGVPPAKLLGKFAQDETAFYVGPVGKEKPGQGQGQKP